MNNIDDEVRNSGSVAAEMVGEKQDIVQKLLTVDNLYKSNEKNKKKDGVNLSPGTEKMNTVRLLGEPLVAHGPYTFYGALAYQKRSSETKGECCCNTLCSCDDNSSSSSHSSLPTDLSGWSVVRMNHFYPVRPWYSKKNSSIDEQQDLRQQDLRNQKHSPKIASSTTAEQHHYQQSVCIGELELLWRDDSNVTANKITQATSLVKKCAGMTTSNGNSIDAMKNRNNNSHVSAVVSSDDDDGVGNDDSAVPRRRMLPRRTRQPSAKKLEATESYSTLTSVQNPLQHSSNHRSQVYVDPASLVNPALSTSDDQYTHGNLLCSVRLYVMPDQTATGRLSGVHGEDEVLEINPWGNGGGVDRWPLLNGGSGVGSIYNGGSSGGGVDDYGYGSGSHSSGTLPSGCSGLVLRAEDFIEWVRGGLMNDDDGNNTQSDEESLESECDGSNVNKEKLMTKILDQEQKSGHTYQNTSVEKYFMKSVVDEAVEAECVPLAAAKIHKNYDGRVKHCYRHISSGHHRPDCTLKISGPENEIKLLANRVTENSGVNDEKCYCYCCKRRRNYQGNNMETEPNSGKQKLIVMSYSRYCRYRAQLQRKCEEQSIEEDKVIMNYDTGKIVSSTCQGIDTFQTTRVLFCRDTYDYPAELLLEPFNAQQNHKPNANVLVNHLAPKLKGWPSYPASWMSFRWNRVRRRLRHLERGSGSHEDRLKRHRRKKLKKKCHGRQNGAGGATTVANINYSSSTEDDDSDDSNSDEASSATNEAATNTTTTASTSDSDGAPPTKRRNVFSPGYQPLVNRPQIGIYQVPQQHSKPKQLQQMSHQHTNHRPKQLAQQQTNHRPKQLVQQQTNHRPRQLVQQQTNHRPRQLAMINQFISQTQRQQHMLVFETEQHRKEREQEERQRRWLVDALRMGGLEVTLVPVNSSGNANNKKKD